MVLWGFEYQVEKMTMFLPRMRQKIEYIWSGSNLEANKRYFMIWGFNFRERG